MIQEARRTVGSDGVDASTSVSEGMNWTRGGQVSRYSPIMDGQPRRTIAGPLGVLQFSGKVSCLQKEV